MKTSNRGFKKVQATRVTNKLGLRVWLFGDKEFASQRELRAYIIEQQKLPVKEVSK